MTIPGVGPITGLAFRVTVDDPARFGSSKIVGAHVGLTPKAGDSMLRHLLYEAASALMTRCRQPSKLRAWGVARTPPRSQTCPRGGGTQAGDDHAPHVGFRERVRDRSGQGEVGRISAGFSSTLHDHNLDDAIGQSDTPLVNALRSGARAVRLDDRPLVSHPGAAAMPDPEQKRDPG